MAIVAHQTQSDKTTRRGDLCQQQREELRQEILTTIAPTIEAAFNGRLNREVATYLGRAKGQHRRSLTPADSPLCCSTCGRHATLDFVRNGSYDRTLLTMWGCLDLTVPRVECACGHCPSIPFTLFDRYDRLWSDLDAAIIQSTALALSLRSVSAVLELQSGQVVSIGAVQRRVAGASVLAARALSEPLATVPAAVMLDGAWGTFMAETGEYKRDKRGRLRKVKRKQKVPVLVAYAVDPATGARELLAWVRGTAEDAEAWAERRGCRGVGASADYPAQAWCPL